MNETRELKNVFADLPASCLSQEDQKALTSWLGRFTGEHRRHIVSALLSDDVAEKRAIPLIEIRQRVDTAFSSLESSLVKNLESFSGEETPELASKAKVVAYKTLIRQCKLSIIQLYLKDPDNTYRTFSFRRFGQPFETYINSKVDFQRSVIFGEYRDSPFSRTIRVPEIDDINWMTNAGELQQIYCHVEQCDRKTRVLLNTINKLIVIRKLEKHVNVIIEDYADIYNIDGLVQHKHIRKFEEWLTETEKVNIPTIDNEIKKTYGRFVDRLERKIAMLKERGENYSELKKKELIIEGGPNISFHKTEVAGGYTFRYVKNNPNATQVELIPPDELSREESSDPYTYFKIPYFNSSEQVIQPVPFTVTEWHMKILSEKMPQLWENANTNTLFMGLAGTGKDYFIKWLSALMNIRQCSFDCRQIEEINDLFYTRRISDGADYFVPTEIYHAIRNPGCLLYLAEVNKLGEKFSDLNAMHDFKREVFIPVDGRVYKLPRGNMIFASANPAWFGGGRSKLEPDVKDRYQNIIKYDYPPFFHDSKNPRLPRYLSHEAEIRYRIMPQLKKLDQFSFRQLWKKMFHSEYHDQDDKNQFQQGNDYIKALIILKRVLQFVNLYRDAYEKFRKAKSDTIATEMLTQRGVEEILNRLVTKDRALSSFDSYRRIILQYMRERFDDVEENLTTVEQFLKAV